MKIPSPNYLDLLGRNKEVETIKNALFESQGKRIVGISGLGGTGKTAFATEVAKSFRELGFKRIVWQIAPVKQDYTSMTFKTVLDEIAKQLMRRDLLAKPIEEQEREIRNLLNRERVLVVLDNMETAADSQEEIANGLSRILGNSKALLTSRLRFETLDIDIFDFYLQGLAAAEAIKLMKQTARERNAPNVNENDLESLLSITGTQSTGYLPLALKLITGQLTHKTPEEISRSLDNVRLREDEFEIDNNQLFKKFWWQIYFRSLTMLSSSDKTLMLILAGLTEQEGTTHDTLREMSMGSSMGRSKLTEQQFEETLVNTRRVCFLEQEQYQLKRYYLHILTRKFFSIIISLNS